MRSLEELAERPTGSVQLGVHGSSACAGSMREVPLRKLMYSRWLRSPWLRHGEIYGCSALNKVHRAAERDRQLDLKLGRLKISPSQCRAMESRLLCVNDRTLADCSAFGH